MASLIERPIDACCPCCLTELEELDPSNKACICSRCEPLRRWCDFRLAMRRPFASCVVFGCIFALAPAAISALLILISYSAGGVLTNASTEVNCVMVTCWAVVELLLCIGNFFFVLYFFRGLRRPDEEREYLYRRDISEAFERYQVATDEETRQARREVMIDIHTKFKIQQAQAIERRKKLLADIAALQDKRAKLDDSLFDSESSKADAKSERARVESDLNKLYLEEAESATGSAGVSLIDLIIRLVRSDHDCFMYTSVAIASLAWSIMGAMLLRGTVCLNPLLMMVTRLMIFGVYVFVVMGVGVCFCNVFAANEVTHTAQNEGFIMTGELESILNGSPTKAHVEQEDDYEI